MPCFPVQDQQEIVKKEFKLWQQLVDRNTSLEERLKIADLERYIKLAIKARDGMLE